MGADLSGRLYDKKLEATKSRKAYFFDLWIAAGWFFGDTVLRLEHQFRRNILAQMQLKTLGDVLAARPGLWKYATSEWTWLAVPNLADETKARWPLHTFWHQVQAIPWEGTVQTLARERPRTNAPSDKVLARMFKAALTSVMARDNFRSAEEGAAKLMNLLMGELQRIEQWEGASAYELLMEAVMLKHRKYCSGLNES